MTGYPRELRFHAGLAGVIILASCLASEPQPPCTPRGEPIVENPQSWTTQASCIC